MRRHDNMFSIIFILFIITTRGSEPPSGKCWQTFTYHRIDPRKPNIWPRVPGLGGHNSTFFILADVDFLPVMPSMRRNAEVALHSMGYFRLCLSSCLTVDTLLLVWLLWLCRVPPMVILTCHGHPAWVVRLDLPLWKSGGELEYCGNFADFADIV
jgi:hypothetical protein